MVTTDRLLWCGCFLWATVSVLAGQTDSAPKPASIIGSVVNAQTGDPVKRADVYLNDDAHAAAPFRAITDSSGKFKLAGVIPGTYRVSVSRTGFVRAHAPKLDAGIAPEVVTLTAGEEITGLVYRLAPGSVLAGRVMDEDGAAFAGVRLQCLKYSYSQRSRRLVSVGFATTDDRGQYRISGLSQGAYYVSASFTDPSVQLGWAPSGAVDGYPSLYYPGAVNAGQAAEIPLREGEERTGIDFKLSPARLVHIQGTVRNQDGRPAGKDSFVSLAQRLSAGLGVRAPVAVVEDGSFRLGGVPPGSYLLTVTTGGGTGNTVRLPLEVGETDLDNVRVLLKPRIELKGRLKIEGDRQTRVEGLQLFLSPTDGSLLMEGGTGIAGVRADGTFVFHAVTEGDYTVQIENLPEDCFLKDVLVAGRAAQDREVHVSEATASALELLLSDTGGRIDGAVKDDKQRPASSVTVVLVPESARRSQADYFRSATTDQYGRFTMRGIPRGDYKLFAWSEDLEPWSWREPAILAPYENRGKAVSVDENGRISVELATLSVQ